MTSGSSACFCNGLFSCTEDKLSLKASKLVKKKKGQYSTSSLYCSFRYSVALITSPSSHVTIYFTQHKVLWNVLVQYMTIVQNSFLQFRSTENKVHSSLQTCRTFLISLILQLFCLIRKIWAPLLPNRPQPEMYLKFHVCILITA